LDVVTRTEAKERGLKYCYTGKECRRGHVAERFVSNCGCIVCYRENARNWYAANIEKAREHSRKWGAANSDKVREKNRNWRVANPEERREKARDWYATNTEKVKENSRNWYAANTERGKENSRRWREDNPQRHRALLKEWAANNPDQVKVKRHKRRARLLNAPGSHTAQDLRDLYAGQDGRCAYCKIEVGNTWHLDHIQPLAKGGSNNRENLQICCPACNMSKGSKDPLEFAKKFAREQGYLKPRPQEPPLSLAPEQKQEQEK
jgi:5-methylcytosine-specific restriction endonuclease McrA